LIEQPYQFARKRLLLNGPSECATLPARATFEPATDVGFPAAPRSEVRLGASDPQPPAYWVAGGHGAQPLYNQFQHAGYAVGCGAVAWPILFGWGDRQAKTGTPYWAGGFGLYRPDGGRGANDIAPLSMTKGVRTMICELRGQLGTVCAFGAGATTRWTMPGTGSYLSGGNPALCAPEQRHLARGGCASTPARDR
jgi:hypothetical protein